MWEEPEGVGLGPWLWRVEMRVGPLEPASPTRARPAAAARGLGAVGLGQCLLRIPSVCGVHEPGGGRSHSPLNEQLPPGP